VVRVDEIRLGNLNIASPGAAANVLPSAAFPGDVLEMDFGRCLISVCDGRPDRPETDVTGRISYPVPDGLIFVDVRINGKPGRATGVEAGRRGRFQALCHRRPNAGGGTGPRARPAA
jgi:hypothetical protein